MTFKILTILTSHFAEFFFIKVVESLSQEFFIIDISKNSFMIENFTCIFNIVFFLIIEIRYFLIFGGLRAKVSLLHIKYNRINSLRLGSLHIMTIN